MNQVKNITLFVLPIVIFSLLTLLLIQRHHLKNFEELEVSQKKMDSVKMEQVYEYILNYGNYISVPLLKEMVVSDSKNRQIKIKQLIKKDTYIFHFDETNCFTCVEKYLPYLRKLSSEVGKDNVIILGSFEKRENLFLSLNGYDLKDIKIYNLSPSYLRDSKIGELNMPYIFEIDSALRTKRFYIPEKSLPGLSELYNKYTPIQ